MTNEQQQGFGVRSANSGEVATLAMQELWLSGTVLAAGARLMVRHVFRSGETDPAEMIYSFGLPADAALHRFRVVGEGFDMESSLKPTEEARETYEAGIEAGSLSTLAQVYRDGLVNLNLGNIRPGETVTVLLELAAGVTRTDNGFRFRFPFTLGPKYHAQATASVNDAGEGEMSLPEDLFGDVILPQWRENADGLHRVGFDLDVLLPGRGAGIASLSHAISVCTDGGEKAHVRLAVEGDVPNRDVILEVACAITAPQVFAGLDEQGKGRFIAVLPSHCFGTHAADAPRSVLFVVDRSGSMSGKPMDQAKRALLACIGALAPEDRFAILFFDDETYAFQPKLVAADQEQRNGARAFIGTMEACGGTNLGGAIEHAAKIMPEGGDVVLLSDGQVFETDALIAKGRKTGLRFHCLGIGSAGEDRFFTMLARATGGVARSVSPRENVGEAALALFSSISAPLAQDLRCAVSGLQEAAFAPAPSAFVKVGHPAILFGSCAGGGGGTLVCAWSGGTVTADIAIADTALGETLKLIQGARITTDIEMDNVNEEDSKRAAARRKKQQNKHLVQLAEEYGLANPAMALVAVVKRADDRPGELPKTRIVPVGMPQDMAFPSYFREHLNIAIGGGADPMCCCDKIPLFLRRRSRTVPEKFCLSEPPNRAKGLSQIFDDGDAPSGSRYLLFALSGELQADGGLPGDVLDTRIARTLALLLAMRQMSGRESGEDGDAFRMMFAPHIRRMTRFLNAQKADTLPQERNALLHQALQASDAPAFTALALWESTPGFDFMATGTETLWSWIAEAVNGANKSKQ